MKSKLINLTVVAITAFGSVSAFAQIKGQNRLEGEAALVVPVVTTSSNLTRAQVQGEYLQIRKNGNLPLSAEANYVPAVALSGNLTRKQVVDSMRKLHPLDGSEKLTQH